MGPGTGQDRKHLIYSISSWSNQDTRLETEGDRPTYHTTQAQTESPSLSLREVHGPLGNSAQVGVPNETFQGTSALKADT